MLVAVPRGHALARDGHVPLTLEMLAGQDLVVYRRTDGPGIFEKILNILAGKGITTNIVDEVHRLIAAINLVAGGRGLTLVPASMQVLHAESIVYRPLASGALPSLPLYVAYRRNTKLALVRNFLAATETLAGSTRPSR